MRKFLSVICSLLVCFIFLCVNVKADVKTPAEAAKFTQYSQHEEITQFLCQVDHLCQEMVVRFIGRTQETRDYGPKDLYLCVITEEGAGCPHELNRGKPTFLVIASQHGNEQSAKEAAMRLIRDLSLGELRPLLKKMNFLVIPQANPYGNWFDQRRNEQDLDLNRDHVKLEAPETQAIHAVFRNWMPEVTMDVHEKGDDYYRISIGCVSNANIHPRLQKFSRYTLLREVEENLKKKNITFHEYLITQRMGIDSSAGVRYRAEDRGKEERMKRYSTTDLNDGRNSLGIYETLSFIQEGASRHDIESLKERTRWQYLGIRYFAESITRHGEEIMSMVRSLRKNLINRANIYSDEDAVHLRMKYSRDEREPVLTIKKFERAESPIRGVLKVDKKAGDSITLADIQPYAYPPRYQVVEEVVNNWFPLVEATVSVSLPLGYIIPAEHPEIVDTLLCHDIQICMFAEDVHLDVEAYLIQEVIPAKYDYLPPENIDVEKKEIQTVVKRGDFYVSCAQPAAQLIPSLLEPQSQYGLIRYWKFNLVPDSGEIFPFFRFVKAGDLPLIPYKAWKK